MSGIPAGRAIVRRPPETTSVGPAGISLDHSNRSLPEADVASSAAISNVIRVRAGSSWIQVVTGGRNGGFDLSPGNLDAWRLERFLRLRHQHPRQHADADGVAALRAENAGLAGVRAHPPRGRADAVSQHDVLRVARLPSRQVDRPQRRLRAALGHQRPAHVHRHLRDHAADRAQDRRSRQGMAGRAGLGVLPELHPDDRRLHRARSSAGSRRAPPCSARWPASPSPSSRCGRRSTCS